MVYNLIVYEKLIKRECQIPKYIFLNVYKSLQRQYLLCGGIKSLNIPLTLAPPKTKLLQQFLKCSFYIIPGTQPDIETVV